jgi:hypothetical protein
VRRHATQGVKGAKPRLRKVITESDGEIERLNRSYLEARNIQMQARATMAQREAALRDGALIDAKRAEAVLAHFLTLFRQRLLWIPARVRAQFQNADVAEFVNHEIRAALEELSELPKAVASGRIDNFERDPTMPDGNGHADEPSMIRRTSRR